MQTSYERHQPHTQRKRKSRDLVYWKTPIANLDILLKGGFAQQTYLFYKTMKGGHGGAQLTFPASSEAEAGGSLGRQLRQHSKRQFETHREARLWGRHLVLTVPLVSWQLDAHFG